MKPLVFLPIYYFLCRNVDRGQQDDRSRSLRTRTRATATTKTYDAVLDWKPPSEQEIQQTQQLVMGPMKTLTSSVFYSTDRDGRVHEGLSRLPPQPENRPMLFVSNHQLVGLDSWLVVNELLDQCNIFARALTHPFLYANEPDGTSFLETYGCLPVSTRNFVRLLQTRQPVLLFPGGVKEAFVQQRQNAYDLTGWAETTDFVRAAAKYNATLVPFSSIGAAESALFWNELPGWKDVAPGVQDMLQRAAGARAPTDARYNAVARQKIIDFPLVFPKPWPARHYFWFHDAVPLPVDYRDRDACAAVYRNVKRQIQDGCTKLVRAAAQDPYRDAFRRVPYEQLTRRSAPSFAVDVLNE